MNARSAEDFVQWRMRLHNLDEMNPIATRRLLACLFTRHPRVAEEVLEVVEARLVRELAEEIANEARNGGDR